MLKHHRLQHASVASNRAALRRHCARLQPLSKETQQVGYHEGCAAAHAPAGVIARILSHCACAAIQLRKKVPCKHAGASSSTTGHKSCRAAHDIPATLQLRGS